MVPVARVNESRVNELESHVAEAVTGSLEPGSLFADDQRPAGVAPERSKYAEFLADAVIQSRGDLEISRQVYGGKPFYVLRDSVSFQSRSLSARDYRIFASIDGTQTCAVVFEHLVELGVLSEGDEEDYYGFLLSLHQRGLLNLPIANGKALFEKYKTRQKRARAGWLMKLLCWKVTFGNPDAWLDRVTGPLKFLMTAPAAIVWLVAVIAAVRVVAQRWDEFATPLASILAMQSIATVMGILIVLKVWHEIGHAVATKGWGGEVPDCGVLLILGTPCAYVDASSAWMIPNRFKRIMVSAAGMYFESIVAILAVAVWAISDDPLTRSLAHHTIFLSTLTTLLFNANPLMKFDGYFMLSDWLDIPNLKSRADESFRWLMKNFVLGLRLPRPAGGLCSNLSLAVFGAASGAYRVLIISGIVAILTWRLPLGGLWLAGAYLGFTLIQQTIIVLRYLWTNPETASNRGQALFASVVVMVMVSIASCWPFERNMSTVGVTEFAGEILVRSKVDGTVKEVHVTEGQFVASGQPLITMQSPQLQQAIERLESENEARELHYRKALIQGEDNVEMVKNEWLATKVQLERLLQRQENLIVRSDRSGVITHWNQDVHPGRRLADGEVFAQVGAGQSVIRTLMRQQKRQVVQPQIGETVWITFPWELKQRHAATVSRVIQSNSEHVRETALTSMAGGEIEVDPTEMKPLEDVYIVEADFVEPPAEAVRIGLRARVCFEDRRQSAAQWIWHRWLDFYRRYHQSI